uniref:PLOD1-3-like GT domain-containing protein n=1 Tax=Lotharella globosa TaxID=91324 RepID=A0A7S3YVP5_9EUKA
MVPSEWARCVFAVSFIAQMSALAAYPQGKDMETTRAIEELMPICEGALNGTLEYCEGIRTTGFRVYLRKLAEQLPEYNSTAGDVSEWDSRCNYFKDAHDPPACVASAYFLVPFDLKQAPQPSTCTGESIEEKVTVTDNTTAPPSESSSLASDSYAFRAFTIETQVGGNRNAHCGVIRTAQAHGIAVDIVGKGVGRIYPSRKLKLMREHVLTIPPEERKNTILLFMDSRDVLIQTGTEGIINGLVKSGAKVLFNAEGNCFPFNYFPMNMILGKDTSIIPKNPVGRFDGFHICGHLFPEAPIPGGPRWLNSGAFVGYADAILDILDLTQELPSWFIDGYPGTDQGFFTQVYLSGKFGMKLDVCNDVFTAFAVHEAESENQIHSLWHLYARGPHRRQWNVLRAERSPEGDSLKVRWVNKRTDKIAPIIHLNGNLKNVYSGQRSHRMKSEYLSIKHGPCSIVRRMEATMFVGSGVGKSWPHGLDFREGDCNYNWEEMARRCAVANDTLELMLDKEKSGLGFWLEFSPVRTFTDLGPEEHRALAMVRPAHNHNLTITLND